MSAVIEYDKNDPRTWPKEEVDGKYVLIKKRKNYGLYEYDVSLAKTYKKPLDSVLAWMRIPTTLKRFGEPPIKDMPGQPNPIVGDLAVLEQAAYIYDGDTWLYYRISKMDRRYSLEATNTSTTESWTCGFFKKRKTIRKSPNTTEHAQFPI